MGITFLLIITLLSCSKDDGNTPEPVNTLAIPFASSASNITDTSFQANWGLVTDADSYLIDVSTNNNFSTFVTGYNALPSTGSSLVITGLSPAISYYYRVRAKRGVEISNNSNVITVTTTGVVAEDPTFLKVKANALANPFYVGVAVKSQSIKYW